MKTLFAAEAISKGARSGTLTSPDGLLNVTLGNPLEEGKASLGPNPELLFAGAYAACFHGALLNAAEKLGVNASDSTVNAIVSLQEDDKGGYSLAVEMQATLPGVDKVVVKEVMDAAHLTCPYSKAMRENTYVKLVAHGD